MRRLLTVMLALGLLPLALVAAPGPARADAPVRLLLYGDSLTQGSSGDWTWRYFLSRHLADLGVPADLVGPSSTLHRSPGAGPDEMTYADPRLDTDHAAVWGQTLMSPAQSLASLATTYVPDVVVALLGVNDVVAAGTAVETLMGEWRRQIAAARDASPGVRVVLVQLPQTWYAGVPDYNTALVGLAAELDRPGSRVVATAAAGLSQGRDTYDNTHPTASGEVKIARSVEDALARVGVGVPAGMVPVVANGPTSAPRLTAAPGVGSVALAWSDVPGVSAEWLEVRDVRAGARWSRYPYAFSAGTVSWRPTGLSDGHVYEFRLRPAKGTAIAEAVTSPVVTAVPGRRPVPPVVEARVDGGGTLRASWAAVADADHYAVAVRDATAGAPWPAPQAVTDTRWTLRGLRSGHAYELRVRADNGAAVGGTSRAIRVAVPRLAAVGGVVVRRSGRAAVRTSAQAVPFATGYRVLSAPTRRCGSAPRASAFRVATEVRRPTVRLRSASARALWVRWYAVRDGVAGRLAPSSTVCVRLR